jgi:3-deoxy-D-manno-octulosonate 8-phosphate phosphatase (KDO 8-P phosphatase)
VSDQAGMVAPDFEERAQRVRLLVLDVDGVLTDGRIVLDETGRELKFFDVQDGHGLRMAQRAEDFRIALLTAQESPIVLRRAEELGIAEVVQGAMQKLPAFERLLSKLDVPFDACAYMGDDVVDLPVLRRVILPIAPANAVPEVIREVSLVTAARGGRGAVREALVRILTAQRKWADLMQRYYT